jgi:phosphoribosyl 1,2-cyclic phosphate phosphodiesterase
MKSQNLRFHLLGSSAGKPVPRPFCRCRVCEIARRDGGRDIRTRTGMHIYLNDDPIGEPRYAIDLPPDTAHQMIREGFRLDRLEHLLFTHKDQDHFEPHYITIRSSILSDHEALPNLQIYGSETVKDALAERISGLKPFKASFQEVAPFEAFQAGELEVFPLLANHGPGVVLNYVVQFAGKRVLLGWDTGWWSDKTWAAVASFRFDAVFMECTEFGPSEKDLGGHLTFLMLLKMKERLSELGCIRADTPYVTLHIGDNGGLTYAEARELAKLHGVTVGYDGLWLEVAD